MEKISTQILRSKKQKKEQTQNHWSYIFRADIQKNDYTHYIKEREKLEYLYLYYETDKFPLCTIIKQADSCFHSVAIILPCPITMFYKIDLNRIIHKEIEKTMNKNY